MSPRRPVTLCTELGMLSVRFETTNVFFSNKCPVTNISFPRISILEFSSLLSHIPDSSSSILLFIVLSSLSSLFIMVEGTATQALSTPLLVVSDPTKGTKVNAAVVAQPFRDEIKAKVEHMKQNGLGKLDLGSICVTRQ